MKTILALISTLAITTTAASAQILGDFYSTQYSSQTPAVAANFIGDGIPVSSSTPVSAFDIGSSAQDLGTVVSNDGKLSIVATAGTAYDFTSSQYPPNDPLFDDGPLTFSSVTLTLSGLATDGLAANSSYTLYLAGSNYTAESGDFNLSFSYGSQTGGPTDPTGGAGTGIAKFTFTTGAVPLDSINLTISKSATGSVDFPAISAFAIVETPEPSTWALMLGGLALLVLLARGRMPAARD